jgi:hypothetical protein
MKVLSIPEEFSLEGKNAVYTASYTKKSDTLIFNDKWKRKSKKIEVPEYENYRNLCNEIVNYAKRPVIMLSTGENR